MSDLDLARRLLSQRAERLRVERSQRAADVRERVDSLVRSILPPGARAWLIGSVAWGGFSERSDIDLVVQGLDAATALRLEIELVRATELEVELLDLDGLPAAFRQRVLSEGIAIHGT